MRNWAWRKWRQEIRYKRRIQSIRTYRYGYIKFNRNDNIHIYHPLWSDLIGSSDLYLYKSISTNKYDSRSKVKYSPNRDNRFYRDLKIKKDSFGTREKDRIYVLKIKNEYGV